MVSGDCEHRRPERAQELRGTLVLGGPPTVGQVAARDHEIGPHPLDERG
jgi:hypothetical protein